MRVISAALIIAGALLAMTGGLQTYLAVTGAYLEHGAPSAVTAGLANATAAEVDDWFGDEAYVTVDGTATPTASTATGQGASVRERIVSLAREDGVTATSSAGQESPPPDIPEADPPPTAVSELAMIVRVVAPTIGLDADVVESPIKDGQWAVPKFKAGHLEGTALPGSGSNVVLTGHVQSVSSGDVFRRIGELEPGEIVVLETTLGPANYIVREVKTVEKTAVAVVYPTATEVLTLITCTGIFDSEAHDYSHRIVVVADRRE